MASGAAAERGLGAIIGTGLGAPCEERAMGVEPLLLLLLLLLLLPFA